MVAVGGIALLHILVCGPNSAPVDCCLDCVSGVLRSLLTGYLRVLRGSQTEQRMWLVVLFLLGYIYYPFNPNAGGEFVFAVVVSNFFLRQGDARVAFRSFSRFLRPRLRAYAWKPGCLASHGVSLNL